MDLIDDLKEGKKEIDQAIRTLERIQHKMRLFKDKLKEKGFTSEQLSKIQDVLDEL